MLHVEGDEWGQGRDLFGGGAVHRESPIFQCMLARSISSRAGGGRSLLGLKQALINKAHTKPIPLADVEPRQFESLSTQGFGSYYRLPALEMSEKVVVSFIVDFPSTSAKT